MSQRFFAEIPVTDDPYILDGEQAHHLANVMRKNVGDEVILFDGTGVQYRTQIKSVSKRKVELAILERQDVSVELSHSVSIAVALPKGDRQKFLIEKLVELGVSKLIPLKTARSVAESNDKVIVRLQRQVIEACKQCGRNRLMKIESQQTLPQLILNFPAESHACFLADPDASNALQSQTLQSQSCIVGIGPEGGFTDQESASLQASNWHPVSLGPAILRIETAALVAAVLLGIGRQTQSGWQS